MVAFFKSLVPLSKKIAEIQTPLVVKRKKRSTSTVDDYWNAPIGKHRITQTFFAIDSIFSTIDIIMYPKRSKVETV